MSISTYDELKSAVASWLARDDLASQIPDFVFLAEAAFNRDLRVRAMEQRATAPTIAGQAYYAWPADLLEVRSIQINTDPPRVLEYLTPEQLRLQGCAAAAATPLYWTDIGASLQLWPTPPAEVTIEIDYYKRLDLAAEGTNWLLARHPDIYLYGTLLQAEPYLHNDARLQTWAQLLASASDQMEREEWRVKSGAQPAAARTQYRGA